MDLEAARKALSKGAAFSAKRLGFFAVAALAVVAGLLLRSGYFGQLGVEQNAPVLVPAPPPSAAAPSEETSESVAKTPTPVQEPAAAPKGQAEQPGAEKSEQTEAAVPPTGQPEFPWSGMILVSRQPINVLASPSSSAPTTFGFPAGRSFRVIGREGGFAQIKDLKSGATGWIDEAALTPPPAASAPSQRKPVAVSRQPTPTKASADPKPKVAKKDSQGTPDTGATTEPDAVQAGRRPGLFGGRGLFGGIFGNGNSP